MPDVRMSEGLLLEDIALAAAALEGKAAELRAYLSSASGTIGVAKLALNTLGLTADVVRDYAADIAWRAGRLEGKG